MMISNAPILVVEDVSNVRELLEITLKFKGYPVITAADGEQALAMALENPPCMVITDILMPKMDGYALVHALRKNPKLRSIPVLFISATFTTSDDKMFAFEFGNVHFIEKPIDTEEFLLTVAETLMSGESKEVVPMDDETFYKGYLIRLENKLRHKQRQIARTERLLQTLPNQQKTAFEALLQQEIADRNSIEKELTNLRKR
jgi:CheY-like chemotaxis protein